MRPLPSCGTHDLAQLRHQTTLLADRTAIAHAARAETGLNNPVADQLLAAAATVQHLSLRNQVMLLIQAAEQKLTLRDVDTYSGWCRRGRMPNTPGLRIVRPQDSRPVGNPAARSRHRGVPFRVDYRWEFAQTIPRGGDGKPQLAADPAGDPAEFVQTLLGQLDRRGYRVQPGPDNAVDHDQLVATVAESIWNSDASAKARALIQAVAEVLTSGPDRRHLSVGGRRAG
jgi:hypothetical protein